ncbi:YkoP family protein [Oceanobacillus sp. CF4.6]|uniref:YkoP family protein n=1 Tax=Oceanobacillus sp. CF4.6 TaxID=3373080 RepID=UPI003EE44E2D
MNMNVRSYFLSVWKLIDPIYYRLTRLEYIVNEEGKRTIIRVRLTRYKGRDFILADGTVIHRNDVLLKIHLHNVNLLKQVQGYDSELRRGLVIYKRVRDALPSIAHYIRIHENKDEIKGLIGITSLYKGCKRLGFETKSIQNSYYKFFKTLSFLPIGLLSTTTKHRSRTIPMYLFMPKDQLLQKYKHV